MIVRNGHISTEIPIRKTKLVKRTNLIVRNGHISTQTQITNFWDRGILSKAAKVVRRVIGVTRTLITSITTLLALFSIFIFGGAILKGFSFAMIVGVIV